MEIPASERNAMERKEEGHVAEMTAQMLLLQSGPLHLHPGHTRVCTAIPFLLGKWGGSALWEALLYGRQFSSPSLPVTV